MRIDDVVKDVAQLKALFGHAEKITSIEDNDSKIQATRRTYLEDRLLRKSNNLRFEGLVEDYNETWDEREAKVKNALVEKIRF